MRHEVDSKGRATLVRQGTLLFHLGHRCRGLTSIEPGPSISINHLPRFALKKTPYSSTRCIAPTVVS